MLQIFLIVWILSGVFSLTYAFYRERKMLTVNQLIIGVFFGGFLGFLAAFLLFLEVCGKNVILDRRGK